MTSGSHDFVTSQDLDACEVCQNGMVPWNLGASQLWQCSSCGHLVRPLDVAPAYHRDHAYGGDPSLDAARLALTYRTLRGQRSPASVFEVGFGAGALLRKFLDGGAEVWGADPDQLELEVDAQVRWRGHLFASGIEEVDPKGIAVDLVYGVHVLEHVVDPIETLRRSAQLLGPSGEVHMLTPAGDWAGLPLYRDGWWMLEDPTHIRFFSADSLARAATKAGFTDVRVRRPVLDSLVTDAASARRRVSPKDRPAGVLAERATMLLAAASSPFVLAGRLANARLRPTLHLVARSPQVSHG